MDILLAQATELAEAGKLVGAMDSLRQVLDNEASLDDNTVASTYELQARCELGELRNVQAMTSFQEAQRRYHQCGMAAESAYCRLMLVRKEIDDRLLREARRQLTEHGADDPFSMSDTAQDLASRWHREIEEANDGSLRATGRLK